MASITHRMPFADYLAIDAVSGDGFTARRWGCGVRKLAGLTMKAATRRAGKLTLSPSPSPWPN